MEEADLIDLALRCPGKWHAVRFQLHDRTRSFFTHVVLSRFQSFVGAHRQGLTYNCILVAEPV